MISTKLALPRLRRGLVARPRILERLDGAADTRLILIAAPAGFGKTTLLSAWFAEHRETGRAIAWLSLGAEDREPASFWHSVVSALQKAVPDLDPEALDPVRASPAPTEPALTAVLNELAGVPDPVWLVLDDFHLADGPANAESMTFLLEHLPAQVHVVISTRADPGLPLARWRARGELVEIRSADLRFTLDETTAYLRGAGLDLDGRDVAALEERTEGWITALQLAALSLQGRTDATEFVARFAGDDRYVVDYLVEEVLGQQTPAVREFLLRSSILGRLTGALCDALTGRVDGQARLVGLERANVFLVPLDDHREWYRYHHLFADVLRARLLSEQPDAVPLLHERASAWFEQHGLIEEAVRHALAAADLGRAVHLMELALPAIRRARQDAIALGWLRALPIDAVRRSPVLTVFAAYGRLVSGDLAGAEAGFDDAERALAGADGAAASGTGADELRTLPATIAVYRASIAQARGDVAETAEHARRALGLAGPHDHLARGGAAGFLGLAAWAAGDVTAAIPAFSDAVASLHAAGTLVDELTSTVVLADLWTAAGRPSAARRLCVAALRTAETHGALTVRAVADLHVGLCEIDLQSGDVESARQHLDAASDGTGPTGMAESRYRWFVASALLAEADGDTEAAVALLGRAEEAYHPGFFPDVRPIGAIRARIAIAHGALRDAETWARQRSAAAVPAGHLREFEDLTLVRLLLAQQREARSTEPVRAALTLLERLLDAADGAGRDRSLLEIRALHALALDAQGRRGQAAEALGHAVVLAPEPVGFARLLLDEGTAMTDLLRETVRRGLGGDDTRDLLRLAERPARAGAGPRDAGSLSERELQVLRLLDSEASGPEIARALFVSQNTLRSHTKHIFTKLDVTSRRAAILRARERGLL
jgi:LuxR family maltose regulon positive regulatory protein